MRLVTFFGTSRQLWGELYLLQEITNLATIRVESVYVLYFVWFLHAHLNK